MKRLLFLFLLCCTTAKASWVTNDFRPSVGTNSPTINISFNPTQTPFVTTNGQTIFSVPVGTNCPNGILSPIWLIGGQYTVTFGPVPDVLTINCPVDTNTYSLWQLYTNTSLLFQPGGFILGVSAGAGIKTITNGFVVTVNTNGSGGSGGGTNSITNKFNGSIAIIGDSMDAATNAPVYPGWGQTLMGLSPFNLCAGFNFAVPGQNSLAFATQIANALNVMPTGEKTFYLKAPSWNDFGPGTNSTYIINNILNNFITLSNAGANVVVLMTFQGGNGFSWTTAQSNTWTNVINWVLTNNQYYKAAFPLSNVVKNLGWYSTPVYNGYGQTVDGLHPDLTADHDIALNVSKLFTPISLLASVASSPVQSTNIQSQSFTPLISAAVIANPQTSVLENGQWIQAPIVFEGGIAITNGYSTFYQPPESLLPTAVFSGGNWYVPDIAANYAIYYEGLRVIGNGGPQYGVEFSDVYAHIEQPPGDLFPGLTVDGGGLNNPDISTGYANVYSNLTVGWSNFGAHLTLDGFGSIYNPFSGELPSLGITGGTLSQPDLNAGYVRAISNLTVGVPTNGALVTVYGQQSIYNPYTGELPTLGLQGGNLTWPDLNAGYVRAITNLQLNYAASSGFLFTDGQGDVEPGSFGSGLSFLNGTVTATGGAFSFYLPTQLGTNSQGQIYIPPNANLTNLAVTGSIALSGSSNASAFTEVASGSIRVPFATPAQSTNVFYVDSLAGNDLNSGRNIQNPIQTLTNVNLLAGISNQTGGFLFLKRNSVFRQQALVTNTGWTVMAYGSGSKPLISGADVLTNSSFTKTAGLTNTYQIPFGPFAYPNPYGGSAGITNTNVMMVWDNKTRMGLPLWETNFTSITNVDENPGTFFYTNGYVYVNASDSSNPATNGRLYEASTRTLAFVGGDNMAVSDIRTEEAYAPQAAGQDGWGFDAQGGGTYLRCEAYRGWDHLMGTTSTFNNSVPLIFSGCYAYDCEVGPSAYDSFIAYKSGLPTGVSNLVVFTNCQAVQPTYTGSGAAFYTHGVPDTNVYVEVFNCSAVSCASGVTIGNKGMSQGIYGFFATNCFISLSISSNGMSGIVFSNFVSTAPISRHVQIQQVTNTPISFLNCEFLNQSGNTQSFEAVNSPSIIGITNCVFANPSQTANAIYAPGSYQIAFWSNIVQNFSIVYNGDTLNPFLTSGDYNTFGNDANLAENYPIGGTSHYVSLSSWAAAATPIDAHSVSLVTPYWNFPDAYANPMSFNPAGALNQFNSNALVKADGFGYLLDSGLTSPSNGTLVARSIYGSTVTLLPNGESFADDGNGNLNIMSPDTSEIYLSGNAAQTGQAIVIAGALALSSSLQVAGATTITGSPFAANVPLNFVGQPNGTNFAFGVLGGTNTDPNVIYYLWGKHSTLESSNVTATNVTAGTSITLNGSTITSWPGGGSPDAPLPDGTTIVSNASAGTWSVVASAITNALNTFLLTWVGNGSALSNIVNQGSPGYILAYNASGVPVPTNSISANVIGNGINISNAQVPLITYIQGGITISSTVHYVPIGGSINSGLGLVTNASVFLPGITAVSTIHGQFSGLNTGTLGAGSNIVCTLYTNGNGTAAMNPSGVTSTIGPNPSVTSTPLLLTNCWAAIGLSVAGSGSFAPVGALTLANQ